MTIKEIASLAGVSVSTVSKIVNNKDSNINAETRSRVLKIVKEYNYSPYSAAKSTADAKTFILGVLLRDTAHTGQFLNGVLDEARRQGYSVMVYVSGLDASTELKNITSLCKNRADGVIWEPVGEESLAHAHYFKELGMECCVMDGPDHARCFHIDYSRMGYEAANMLLKYRHSRIGCLLKEGSRRSELVFEGFRKCLFDHQIPYQEKMRLSVGSADWPSGILAHAYTGLVSSHYDSTLFLLEQLDKFKYCVPHDLSIVSLRGDRVSTPMYPRISAIRIPYYDFGSFLCGRLIDGCEKRPPRDRSFEPDYALESLSSLDYPSPGYSRKIVVVGSINIDITLNVESLPQPGDTMITDKCSVIPGGKGANQAVGAAKLGNEVCLIGKVGNDYDATLVYSSMEEHRVGLQGIGRDSYTETGKAYIHVQKDGESTITILTGANKTLAPEDIHKNRRLFDNAGYCLLQTEVPQDALEEAAKTARAHGVKTILKPAAITSLPLALMPYTDIFVPNKREAQALCPEGTVEEKAARFLELGAGTVIITLGHSGCYMRAEGQSRYFPAAPFTAADTTGAADAFIAALAVYLLNGCPMEKAIPIATCAAGFCVSRQGVIPALIDRNSLETYIRNTDPDLLRP